MVSISSLLGDKTFHNACFSFSPLHKTNKITLRTSEFFKTKSYITSESEIRKPLPSGSEMGFIIHVSASEIHHLSV